MGVKHGLFAGKEEHTLQVRGNKFLKEVHRSEKVLVNDQFRILFIEERHDLYRSNIIALVKPGRLQWVGYLDRMWETSWKRSTWKIKKEMGG
jgi:hypothetical protein